MMYQIHQSFGTFVKALDCLKYLQILFTLGYARVSNVEFYHTGQEGWTDEYDPRFSIAFLDTGASTEVRPSYLRNSAFHHGFAPAIGTFGVERLNITNNVIYHTVGSCK